MNTALTSEQIEQFEKNGYLVFRSMVPASACEQMLAVTQQHMRDAIAPLEYEADVGYAGAPKSLDAPGGKTIRRLRGAYQRDACFRTWSKNPGCVTRPPITQVRKRPRDQSHGHHPHHALPVLLFRQRH